MVADCAGNPAMSRYLDTHDGCSFETLNKTGHGVAPLPAPLGTPCAEE
jgi:hypothetical protein